MILFGDREGKLSYLDLETLQVRFFFRILHIADDITIQPKRIPKEFPIYFQKIPKEFPNILPKILQDNVILFGDREGKLSYLDLETLQVRM